MPAIIITPEDLQEFKDQLLKEITALLSQRHAPMTRKWLKTPEVRRILGMSQGTLQNLRINGTLPFTKIGGLIYYDSADIDKMLEERKQNLSFEERIKGLKQK